MRYRDSTEKPYQLVPFASERPSRKVGLGQDRLQEERISGWLEVEFVTLTPLQVATGIVDFIRTTGGKERLALTQASVKHRADDDPNRITRQTVLPGSSLKGAIRSLVEVLSPSCVLVVSDLVRSALPRRLIRCTDPKNLCPACRLFGSQNYQGQISIDDAKVPPRSLIIIGTPLLWAPARTRGRGLPPLYLEHGEVKGRKVYKHHKTASGPEPRVVIKQNVRIPTRLSFTNLTEGELGLLVTALGNHPQYPFPIKIGAGKPVGMGSVEVHIQKAVLLSGSEGVKRTGRLGKAVERGECLEGETLKARLAQWTQKAQQEQLLLIEQLQEVAQVLSRQNLNIPAPERY